MKIYDDFECKEFKMIFEVNTDGFIKSIKPAAEVASKNTIKDFKFENLMTIEAQSDGIKVCSYGGSMSLISNLSNKNFDLDYNSIEEGRTTVYADDIIGYLMSLPKGFDRVKISLDSNQLKIESAVKDDGSKKKKKGKKTKFSERSMPTVPDEVVPPKVSKNFEQEVELDREVFVKGMESVIFAPAFEDKMYSYMCMLFEAICSGNKELRFSAGTGGRFAVKSIRGKNVIANDKQARIIFPKNSLGTTAKLLSEDTSEKIMVKLATASQKDNVSDQIVIEFNGMTFCIFGLEHFTKYPDLTKIINHKYPNRVYSSLDDWRPIVNAIETSRNRWGESIHNTDIELEEEDEVFKITPRVPQSNPTFIDMEDIEDCVCSGEKVWFRCNSDYIREMVTQGNSGKIQLNFESQEILNDIPDDKPKQMKPILVKFPEDVDEAKDTVDNFYMFFTVSTKE